MAAFDTSDLLIHDFQFKVFLLVFSSFSKQYLVMCPFLPHMFQLPFNLEYLILPLLLDSMSLHLLNLCVFFPHLNHVPLNYKEVSLL